MYAVIRTGGKQYTVKPGDVLQVEKLDQDLGAEFTITDVLLIGGESAVVGTPLVKGATVTVTVTKQAMSRKIDVFKKKRRHSFRKWKTHRQEFTELFVNAIAAPGGKSVKTDEKPVVKDMAALREGRIKTKQAESRARAEGKGQLDTLKEEVQKVAKKKVAKKAGAKKATGKAKSTGKKKAGAKKAAKKTTKK